MIRKLLIVGLVLFSPFVYSYATTLTVERGNDLQSVINYAHGGDTLLLGSKTFEAKPTDFIDSLCGNCQDPHTAVKASYGFIIKDKKLVIIGRDRKLSKLVTQAGYGIYFINSNGSVISNLTITGGKRDPDGNATDAGIVVRNSKLVVEKVDIRDNDHRIDSVVVGIGGIFGREGAEITAKNCTIINNGWDGVALYRGAIASVTDCLIKDGRGAGIGVTWDATCVAYRNEISGYWKGIGAFGASWVIARNNLVHENLGWGIIATGKSYMDITNNVVYHNGNCGIAPWSTESKGRIVNNIVVANGWRDEWVCPCVGIWNYGDWAKWYFAHNIVWNNKNGDYKDIWEQTGINGNISQDPLFMGKDDFHLKNNSPAINNGDSTIYDIDGSVSDMGLYGGPQAFRE
ncbi:MAG: right-handed parallel beta-helix repeat-containing protein [FCB group bacterium]|nr:right-handed parallel beta-helix repeat-containing protein [FCB group bacterium]